MVAEVEIAETNPSKQIHGKPIGLGAYTICVKVSYVDDALVYQATSEVRTVHDVVSNFITWPKDRIIYQ